MIVLALTVNYPLAAEARRINTTANMKGVSAGSRAIRAVRRPIHSGFAPGPRARSTALDRSRYASSYSLIKYQIESTLKQTDMISNGASNARAENMVKATKRRNFPRFWTSWEQSFLRND